ncbi:MAG: hypothetical protein ABIN95_08025, partial [Mucilaginibacter sp.]
MNLKTFTAVAFVLFAISSCKKSEPVLSAKTDNTSEKTAALTNTADCNSTKPSWDKFFSSQILDGYISATSVIADKFGNIITAGTYDGTIDLDPGTAVKNISGTGIYIQALDAKGNYLGSKSIPVVRQVSRFDAGKTDLNIDNKGNIYLTINDIGSVQIIKANYAGNLLNIIKFKTTGDLPVKTLIDKNGNLITVGSYQLNNPIDLDPGAG